VVTGYTSILAGSGGAGQEEMRVREYVVTRIRHEVHEHPFEVLAVYLPLHFYKDL
jgi:hypothetical protein